jgi:uncharacterized membrane protein
MSYLAGYRPADDEAEKASGSYLMSMMAMAVGVALPIVNLIATLIFYLGNRRSTYFVRWHCTQALVSQLSMLPINSFLVGWTLSIFLTDRVVTNGFVAYVLVASALNMIELFMTGRSAVMTRRGEHVSWYFYGPLTDLLCAPDRDA